MNTHVQYTLYIVAYEHNSIHIKHNKHIHVHVHIIHICTLSQYQLYTVQYAWEVHVHIYAVSNADLVSTTTCTSFR